jgi:glycosyltransferase involved in cell wall biosynthesis
MNLLFVADGRSPIALNWMRYFSEGGHYVHLVSLYPCNPDIKLASLEIYPVAFGLPGSDTSGGPASEAKPRRWPDRLGSPRLRTLLRQSIVPLRLPLAARRLGRVIEQVQPDLVHAMRLPYEGMAAALAGPAAPLVISIWGNDFTLHAPSNPLTARFTRLAMARADALHPDCRRDARLALEWGFPKERPMAVLPSSGGVQLDLFHPPDGATAAGRQADRAEVINPRGLRAYVRNDTFFQAVPMVIEQRPDVRFLCPGMAGAPAADRWLNRYGGAGAVSLLPKQTRREMAGLFREARIAISLTTHDGTPNTLLEAMASGCYPIAGDLESLREWITHGLNGALVDPANPREVAEAIISALDDPGRLASAADFNLQLIQEKAEYRQVMAQAEDFYGQLSQKG